MRRARGGGFGFVLPSGGRGFLGGERGKNSSQLDLGGEKSPPKQGLDGAPRLIYIPEAGSLIQHGAVRMEKVLMSSASMSGRICGTRALILLCVFASSPGFAQQPAGKAQSNNAPDNAKSTASDSRSGDSRSGDSPDI